MLEAACMNIAQWYGEYMWHEGAFDLMWDLCIRKAPRDGKVIDLPFLGRLLQVELPTPFKPQLLETTPFDMNKLKPDVQVG